MSAELWLLVIAFAITYVGAMCWWVSEFPDAEFWELIIGALWSFIVAAIFPLIWVGLVVVALVYAIRYVGRKATA